MHEQKKKLINFNLFEEFFTIVYFAIIYFSNLTFSRFFRLFLLMCGLIWSISFWFHFERKDFVKDEIIIAFEICNETKNKHIRLKFSKIIVFKNSFWKSISKTVLVVNGEPLSRYTFVAILDSSLRDNNNSFSPNDECKWFFLNSIMSLKLFVIRLW